MQLTFPISRRDKDKNVWRFEKRCQGKDFLFNKIWISSQHLSFRYCSYVKKQPIIKKSDTKTLWKLRKCSISSLVTIYNKNYICATFPINYYRSGHWFYWTVSSISKKENNFVKNIFSWLHSKVGFPPGHEMATPTWFDGWPKYTHK